MSATITPCLWFDQQAQQAVDFYVSLLPESASGRIAHYPKSDVKIDGMPPEGSILTIEFTLCGQLFTALNGGPFFKFTPAISLCLEVPDAETASSIFKELSQSGSVLMPLQKYPFSECFGWVEDRFGLSWQINATGTAKPVIAPGLMFVREHCGQAEEAMLTYANLIPGSNVESIVRYGAEEPPNKEGTIKIAAFSLAGVPFRAMDNAFDHEFDFTEAVSFQIYCPDQQSIDRYWDALSKDGPVEDQQCGWLRDRFGVSWQIVPDFLGEVMVDPVSAEPVMAALHTMKKLDYQALKDAAAQRAARQ